MVRGSRERISHNIHLDLTLCSVFFDRNLESPLSNIRVVVEMYGIFSVRANISESRASEFRSNAGST